MYSKRGCVTESINTRLRIYVKHEIDCATCAGTHETQDTRATHGDNSRPIHAKAKAKLLPGEG